MIVFLVYFLIEAVDLFFVCAGGLAYPPSHPSRMRAVRFGDVVATQNQRAPERASVDFFVQHRSEVFASLLRITVCDFHSGRGLDCPCGTRSIRVVLLEVSRDSTMLSGVRVLFLEVLALASMLRASPRTSD